MRAGARRPAGAAFLWAALLLGGCGEGLSVPPDAGKPGSGDCRGKPDGTPCGNPSASDCDAPDTCQAGVCEQNHQPAGAECGNPSHGACDAADTCDANGACQPNLLPWGTPCGEATQDACTAPDSCDGTGACLPHHGPDGTSCGDAPSGPCDGVPTCLQGVCAPNHAPDGQVCGAAPPGPCTGVPTCLQGSCAPNHAPDGTPCGNPAASACDLADLCVAGACAPNFAPSGTPCGSAAESHCDRADGCDGTGDCAQNREPDGTACADCAAGPGQCGTCALGSCPTVSCAPPGATQLTTTFAGGNNHSGNMFDVTAATGLTVTQITVHPKQTGSFTVAVYTTPGGTSGKVSSPSEWVLQASVTFNAFAGIPALLPITFNLPLAANSTTGFYVTTTNSTQHFNYTNGTMLGGVAAANAQLTIHQGYGLGYPFDAASSPRIWNGTLGYAVTSALGSGGTGNTLAAGQMFDVRAQARTRLTALDLRLAMGTHAVNAYFRPGSHVGFENDASAWYPVGSASGLAGGGAPARLELSNQVVVPAGQTYALYLTSPTTGGALLTSPAMSVGTVTTSNASLELRAGVGVNGLFGGQAGIRAFDGAVHFHGCP